MAKALKCDGCRKVVAGQAYDDHDWYAVAKWKVEDDDPDTIAHACSVDCIVRWAFAHGADVALEISTL